VQNEIVLVGEPGASVERVRAGIRSEWDLLVLVGGDGTLRSYLRALEGSDVPVLLVPGGTSNLIATHLRVPSRPKAVVKLLQTGEIRNLDVARLDGEPFVLAAGFGLATDVIQYADHELKRHLGPIAYLWSLFRNLYRRRVKVQLRFSDGRVVRHRAKLVLFTNCAETLAQVDIVPNSAIDDGLVDVAVFHFADFWQFLRLVGYGLTGRWRRAREAVFYRASEVEVRISPALPIQIDGDVFEARSRFRIDVAPTPIRVLAPPPRTFPVPREWWSETERRLELLRTGSKQTATEIMRTIWEEYLVVSRRLGASPMTPAAWQRRGEPGRAGEVPKEGRSAPVETGGGE
jgi:diacylglycerol kinase family enzyme